MKTWVYSWIIYPIGYSLAFLVALFHGKTMRSLRLRSWKDFIGLRLNASQPIHYWIHVASSGELEYAIPLIEELQKRNLQVLITYYSISAKQAVEKLTEKYSNVCLVVPLPHDGLGLMREFVRLVKKQGVHSLLIMKYELWPGLLWECKVNQVSVLLVDALKPSWFHKRLIHKLDALLMGYESETHGVDHPSMTVLGDTRIDQVVNRSTHSRQVLAASLPAPVLKALENGKNLVLGSVWPADLKCIAPSLKTLHQMGVNVVVVPHEIETSYIKGAIRELEAAGYKNIITIDQKTSAVYGGDSRGSSLGAAPIGLVVARRGILVELYSLAHAAYVGGGFGRGVHSLWEALIGGAWLAAAPRRGRSPETYIFDSEGLLTIISSPVEFKDWVHTIFTKPRPNAEIIQKVMAPHRGAAMRIIDYAETKHGRKRDFSNDKA